MGRNIKLLSIFIGTLPSAFAAAVKDTVANQSASTILSRGITALGGSDALNKIQGISYHSKYATTPFASR